MASGQRGEFSASIAILGLLGERPDTAAAVGQRLMERFPHARFARSVVHNALPSLAGQGLVECTQEGRERALDRYRLTAAGEATFRQWLREPRKEPPSQRDAAQARLAFAAPEDLDALIAAAAEEERFCAEQYAAAHAQLLRGRLPNRSNPDWWQAVIARLACNDEAMLWLARLKRLQRLQTGLLALKAEIGEQLAAGGDSPAARATPQTAPDAGEAADASAA